MTSIKLFPPATLVLVVIDLFQILIIMENDGLYSTIDKKMRLISIRLKELGIWILQFLEVLVFWIEQVFKVALPIWIEHAAGYFMVRPSWWPKEAIW